MYMLKKKPFCLKVIEITYEQSYTSAPTNNYKTLKCTLKVEGEVKSCEEEQKKYGASEEICSQTTVSD